VGLALLAAAALLLVRRGDVPQDTSRSQSTFGGQFTLTGAGGKPFASSKLAGKPYVIFFGFTRCGDVCPTTLSRLVKLRQEVGGPKAFNIVFVTIDPAHDGPKEVGQYAELFNSPIIGLTGSVQQIDAVKKQYAIFAQPMPDAPAGQAMEHTGTVLLFDRSGKLAGTISPNESDASAVQTLKGLV
jgi:protein SCO1/2